jgi:3'-phosphoadenosine 5'-phosphosulfate sulfotransferase (PAPS reductase)/FAD synthetase
LRENKQSSSDWTIIVSYYCQYPGPQLHHRYQKEIIDSVVQISTSDLKRAPVHRLMTRLAEEQRARGITRRRVRILNVLGLRAQESPLRAAMDPFTPDQRASNKTVRMVDQWLPIHSWTSAQVWQRIAEAGTRPHPIYAQGMPRHIDRTKRGCSACRVGLGLGMPVGIVQLSAGGLHGVSGGSWS